jgi:hypothetical protein
MRKTWLCLMSAVTIGLAFILIPLVTVTELRTDDSFAMHMESLEGNRSSDVAQSPSHEIDMLAISFFVALAVYALSRRKTPKRSYKAFNPYPFQN